LQRKLCFLIQGGGHTWEQLLHPDLKDADGRRLFEVHPEWFAEIDGQRNPGGYHPCVSNEQAVDYLIDRFIEQIQTEFRHCDLINYWPYDTWQEWCQCERCQALGNGTDRYIFVAAQTHRRLREAHAQGMIPHIPRVMLCAYEGTKTTVPPTRPLPPSFDTDLSAFIFFPINRCYAHYIDDPTCTEINAKYRQEFEGWAESPYEGHIVIGEYYNVSKFEDLPLLFYRTMPHDMAYYCAHRARGFNYMHATAGQWGTKTLTNWEMARLCWDVQEDPAKLLERFFSEYFGPVAAEMRAVFALIEAAFANVAAWRNWAGTSVTSVMRQVPQDSRIQSVFPLRHLQFDRRAAGNDSAPSALEGLRNIDQAREQIDDVLTQEMPEEVRQRVAEVEFLFRYGELSYRLYCSLAQVVSLERGGETDAARAEFLKADRIARELAEINFQYTYCSPPGNRFNALVKTQVDNVVEHYRKLFNLKS
jgi:hypothetical protein